MLDLVRNPEDGVSCSAAHFIQVTVDNCDLLIFQFDGIPSC